jgi:dTMP kinase
MTTRNCEKGRFITFEGLDGTGKTTQIQLLASVLANRGIEYVVTREPGGTPLGEDVRAILLDSRRGEISAHAELALLFACRAQLLHDVIDPALERGHWVLCDRFTDSSEAYQGSGRKLGSEVILAMHKMLAGDREPWMTVLLDGDLETSLTRARARNGIAGSKDEGRFEAESIAFYRRVESGFREVAARETHRVVMVDARRSVSSIHEEIVANLDRRITRDVLRDVYQTETAPESSSPMAGTGAPS